MSDKKEVLQKQNGEEWENLMLEQQGLDLIHAAESICKILPGAYRIIDGDGNVIWTNENVPTVSDEDATTTA